MKYWKKSLSLIFVLFAFLIITCDGNNDVSICKGRTDTAIDDINCGGENCHCLPKIYGNFDEIKIYRQKTIQDEQAQISAGIINEIYYSLKNGYISQVFPEKINVFSNRIKKIYITSGDFSNNSKLIVLEENIWQIGCDTPQDVMSAKMQGFFMMTDEIWEEFIRDN